MYKIGHYHGIKNILLGKIISLSFLNVCDTHNLSAIFSKLLVTIYIFFFLIKTLIIFFMAKLKLLIKEEIIQYINPFFILNNDILIFFFKYFSTFVEFPIPVPRANPRMIDDTR